MCKPSRVLLIVLASACQEESVLAPPQPLFSEQQWAKLQSLADLPDPPPDPSNKYAGDAAAAALGKKFYFDPQFSGVSTLKDTLGRSFPADEGRAPAGENVDISCNTCHDVTKAGTDPDAVHVAIGVGAYDVNAQQTVNAAYFSLLYWNGRNDSLWAQIVAVGESGVSMGGSRLKTAWRIADAYRAEYTAVFGTDWPLPAEMDSVVAQKARFNADDGTCIETVPGVCPELCHEVTNTDTAETACVPRFPIHGKPGKKAGCQWADAVAPVESLKDAFDCMTPEDRAVVTRIYVNFAKAIAAYEYTLISRNSAFDQFVDSNDPGSDLVSADAKAGAKLFIGAGWCAQCHSTPLFSDGQFHDIGVPQVGEFVPTEADCPEGGSCDCVAGTNCLPWGFRDGLAKLHANQFRRDSSWSDDPDVGQVFHELYNRPLADAQKGQWRTPSLRDVEKTAPYMHDGIYATLDEVVRHYQDGSSVKGPVVGQVDGRIGAMMLTDDEFAQLVEFLKTLTGEPLPDDVTSAPVLPAATPF
jgi:cytochrome c peroxidase